MHHSRFAQAREGRERERGKAKGDRERERRQKEGGRERDKERERDVHRIDPTKLIPSTIPASLHRTRLVQELTNPQVRPI